MGFVVQKMILGHCFLRVLLFSPVSITLPLLYAHSGGVWALGSLATAVP